MPTVTDMESYQQFAEQQQQANNAFNEAQAAKQMAFQERLSSTAHQREVADLKAAGLNPVLSAGGQGASSAQGAAAEADNSTAANVGGILQQVLQAQSAREVANMYNQASILAAQIAASASMYGADMAYQNAEDHPKTPQEVLARALNDSGIPGMASQAVQEVLNALSNGTGKVTANSAKATIAATNARAAATGNTAFQRILNTVSFGRLGNKSTPVQSYNKLYNSLSKFQKVRFKAYCAVRGIKSPTYAQLSSWMKKQ